EEEISGKNGLACVLPELPAIDFALVGEPTGMQPAIAERGLMVLDGIVRGEAGHAARNEGDNAIYKAIPVIQWFKNTEFPLKSELLGAVKMTVTVINAGTQHNVIPDECRFTVDVRSNEHYTNRALFDWIAAHCGCEITARSFRLNSSGISIEHPCVQRAMLLGRQAFGSPTTSDQAQMPFPSLKMGPGESLRSHTADEYILLPEIREAMELYIRLLDNLELIR
ncbi:MAG: peptidase dimerization domain-containing protein, partial [Dysgonamonadaceae bacterium]|nr:peptidase dimerization domain-containing protein [Dysgonamonadaceae bacterium]